MTIEPRPISGFAEYSEAQNVALAKWIRLIEDSYRRYGFSRLFPRPLELREVLLSKGGIQKQVFGVSRLPSEEPTELALPFDRTIPLANWVASQEHDIVFPYKRYDISYSFRGERAQAGRFQGFFQADVDIIGSERLDLSSDAECIAVIFDTLRMLNIGVPRILISNTQFARTVCTLLGVGVEQVEGVLRIIDKLRETPVADTRAQLTQLTGLEEGTVGLFIDLFGFEGNLLALGDVGKQLIARAPNALDDLTAVWTSLLALGIPPQHLVFAPRIVRGLDYYSGTVFETMLDGYENLGSIASGGRYDDLASTFTSSKLPGVGGSIGLTRLFDLACRANLVALDAKSEAPIFVGFRTIEQRSAAEKLATALRRAGYAVDLYSADGRIKKQLSYADRKGSIVTALVMDVESIVVRRMSDGSQTDLTCIADAISAVNLIHPPM